MFTTLKDFPFDKAKATQENIEDYKHMLNCIKDVENSEMEDTDENLMVSLVWSEVFFIGTLNPDMKRIPTNTLKTRLNMMNSVLEHMSGLTYKEFLSIFPIPIYFDGSCLVPLYSNPTDSFIGHAYEALGEYGIDLEEHDFDEVIGDKLQDLTCGDNVHPVLRDFYRVFYATGDLLRKRNDEHGTKRPYLELIDNL